MTGNNEDKVRKKASNLATGYQQASVVGVNLAIPSSYFLITPYLSSCPGCSSNPFLLCQVIRRFYGYLRVYNEYTNR